MRLIKQNICIFILILLAQFQTQAAPAYVSIDSLENLLDTNLSQYSRLDILYQTCELLSKKDSEHLKMLDYAHDGLKIAQNLNQVEKGSNLAGWIIRANIYLRSYEKNAEHYAYLKRLYQENKIEKTKYMFPMYLEIYSYIDYGNYKEAEKRMSEFETLIDKTVPRQAAYYLDCYINFKSKAKEYEDASIALAQFTEEARKMDDPRFLIMALSRNSSFYLNDSIDYANAKHFAKEALQVIDDNKVNQLRQPLLVQLAKSCYYNKNFEKYQETYRQIKPDSFANNIVKKDYFTFSGDIEYDNKSYEEAASHYKNAVQFLENSDFRSMEELTKKIERCYVKLEDYKTAYKYANRTNVLQDSLNTSENSNAIKLFESKLKKKDLENERIKYENKIYAQKKSTLFIGFFSSLILLSLLLYNRILDEKVKQRTVALNTKNKQLKSSIEELEQFNYIASHDIKEPMRVVSSITGLIHKKLKKNNENAYDNEFNLVNDSINQLYTLIEDLSQFIDFKSKTITHQIVDTNQLASHVNTMLSKQTTEVNGTINFNNLPSIYSSSALLTVIFKNLIENGLKYNNSENPTVDVSYKLHNDKHQFEFKDNGIGIDSKYHEYIFQMFKRLEARSKKGSGLGLGLVSKSIEKLAGEIRVDSAAGQGSTFIISLPQSYIVNS